MTTALTIRFEGLCCHVGEGDAPRRTILPDASGHDHISYIEFFADDCTDSRNPSFPIEAYTVDGFSYKRTPLINKKVALKTPIVTPDFTVMDSYKERIPQLQKVLPTFEALDSDLLAPQIPSGKVAAYFDMSKGTLSSGPSEGRKTKFEPEHAWPQGRVGEWVQLDVEIDGDLEIELTDLATNETRTLRLNPGTNLITIGNQTIDDILEAPGVPMPGHFPVYYTMAGTSLGANLPQPDIGMGLGIGCSNSNFP